MKQKAQQSMTGKTLILGLGNDMLTDDGVGLVVVRQLAGPLRDRTDVEVCETTEMGLALLDFMEGFEQVILVDSIQTGRAEPGTLHEVEAHGVAQLTGRTPHFLGVEDTLALGRELGLTMPQRVTVVAIEVADPFTLGTELTPPVARAVPRALARVEDLIDADASGTPRRSRGVARA